MTLVLKLGVLGWLYFIQGIPFGLQDKFIPLHLRLQQFNFSRVSLMKSLLLPWLCKALWAPFTQVWFSPKHWLIFSILGMSLVSYIGSTLSPQNISSIAIILFLMNILSSLQDVIVDGFTISWLNDNQLGIGNTLQVVIYKIGSLLGGAGLIYLSSFTSWKVVYITLSVIYLISAIGSYYLPNDKLVKKHNLKKTDDKTLFKGSNHLKDVTKSKYLEDNLKSSSFYVVIDIFRDVFRTKDTLWLCIFVLFYKMGERGVINNFPLYLLDKGITAKDLAFWNGLVCQFLSILGSTFGGILLSSRERQKSLSVLKIFIIHRFVSVVVCYFIILHCSQQSNAEMISNLIFGISIVALCYMNFTSGVISTATFTLMMEDSKKLPEKSQSTHYSVVASLEVAGKLVFATLAGILIDLCGIVNSFFVFLMMSLVPYIILKLK